MDKTALDNAIGQLPVQLPGPGPPGISLKNAIEVRTPALIIPYTYDIVCNIVYDIYYSICIYICDIVYDIAYNIISQTLYTISYTR